MPHRFMKRTHHLAALEDELVMVEDTTHTGDTVRKRADRNKLGYMRMTVGGRYYIVGPPALFPDETPKPSIQVIAEALQLAKDNGITRLSFNARWKPENLPKYYTFPTYEKDKSKVLEALRENGYEEGDKVRGSLDDFKSKVLAYLGHETEEGFWT